MSKRHLTPVEKLCKEIIMHGNTVFATSLDVAEHFGKIHRDVLRAINNLECSAQFSLRNFAQRDFIDSRGKERPIVEMTRDGFAMLVMGFTGKEAAKWKEAYIAAFNRMERHIRAENRHNSDAWREANASRINAEKAKSASIHDFIKYAISQGSKHSGWYFANFAKMINAIAVPENPFAGPLLWTPEQNARVSSANTVCEIAIYEGIHDNVFYRDIFYDAKTRLQDHALNMGWPVAVLGHDLTPPDDAVTPVQEKKAA